MTDLVIIGSGAAATAAALALVQQGLRPVMLDVGYVSAEENPRVEGNLYEYRRRHDSFDLHIGTSYSGLTGVLSEEASVAKLNAPNMAFVTRDAGRLGPLEQENFPRHPELRPGRPGQCLGRRALSLG